MSQRFSSSPRNVRTGRCSSKVKHTFRESFPPASSSDIHNSGIVKFPANRCSKNVLHLTHQTSTFRYFSRRYTIRRGAKPRFFISLSLSLPLCPSSLSLPQSSQDDSLRDPATVYRAFASKPRRALSLINFVIRTTPSGIPICTVAAP